MTQKNKLSSCCKARLITHSSDEGTSFYECSKCHQSADEFYEQLAKKSYTCEKHNRILIGKNRCVDCDIPRVHSGQCSCHCHFNEKSPCEEEGCPFEKGCIHCKGSESETFKEKLMKILSLDCQNPKGCIGGHEEAIRDIMKLFDEVIGQDEIDIASSGIGDFVISEARDRNLLRQEMRKKLGITS